MRPTGSEEIIYQFVVSGMFSIDDEGRVWRHTRRNGRGVAKPCETRRAEFACGAYLYVVMTIAGRTIRSLAHRLVFRHASQQAIPDGLTVNHKNGNKRDNSPLNLELATYSEQRRHALDVLGVRSVFGSAHHKAKLTEAQVLEIRQRSQQGERASSLASEFGIAKSTMSSLLLNRIWKNCLTGGAA